MGERWQIPHCDCVGHMMSIALTPQMFPSCGSTFQPEICQHWGLSPLKNMLHFKKEKAEALWNLRICHLLCAQTAMFYSLNFTLWRALEKEVRYKTFSEILSQMFKGTMLIHFCITFQCCSSDHKSQDNIVTLLVLEKALSLKLSQELTSKCSCPHAVC